MQTEEQKQGKPGNEANIWLEKVHIQSWLFQAKIVTCICEYKYTGTTSISNLNSGMLYNAEQQTSGTTA